MLRTARPSRLLRETRTWGLSRKPGGTHDWGSARKYVEGIWRILQHHEPDDFVLATGERHSVRSFVEAAFRRVGKEIVWEGEDVDQVGRERRSSQALIRTDKRYFRPTEADLLIGVASKAPPSSVGSQRPPSMSSSQKWSRPIAGRTGITLD